jgi:uncharacterized protein (TIGR02453 family)
MKYFTSAYFSFFEDLAANNNTLWFQSQRARFVRDVKDPFERFVGDCLVSLAKRDVRYSDVMAKQLTFRLNRDVRFSPDKSAYKLHMSAVLSPQGKKAPVADMYVHFGPGESLFAGGLYMPDSAQLAKARKAIVRDPKRVAKLLAAKKFVDMYGEIHGDELRGAPRGMKAEAEEIPLLKKKQFYFEQALKRKDVIGEGLVERVVEAYDAGAPIVAFFKAALK